MRIRTQGNQAFNVPNTDEGHLFLRLLRKFRNGSWYYRARGRGSRKEHGCQASLPKQFSDWMAVYLTPPAKKANPEFSVPMRYVTNLGNGPIAFDGQSWSDLVPNQDNQFQIPLRYAEQTNAPLPPIEYHPPEAILSGHVAEWSAQIGPGDPVAMNGMGRIYNAEVHGVGPGAIQIGVAMGHTTGSIGEGEAHVPIRLDLGEINVTRQGDPVPWPQYPEPVAQADDTVELTAKEQELLEEILFKLHNEYATQNWEGEKQDLFDSLFEKLVD